VPVHARALAIRRRIADVEAVRRHQRCVEEECAWRGLDRNHVAAGPKKDAHTSRPNAIFQETPSCRTHSGDWVIHTTTWVACKLQHCTRDSKSIAATTGTLWPAAHRTENSTLETMGAWVSSRNAYCDSGPTAPDAATASTTNV
jgi:hypothetical protein